MCQSIPLKAAMAGLFALITAVAVIVAFVPTTVIGIDSHRSTATSLHQRTTEYVRQNIATLLSPPTDLYNTIRLLQQQGAIDGDILTPANISNATDDRARRLQVAVKGLTRTSAGLLVSRVFTYAPAAYRYYGAGDNGVGTPINSYTVVENGTYNYKLTNSTSPEVFSSYTTYLDIPYIEALDEIQVAKNITVDNQVVCSPRLVLGFIGVAISCAFRTPDPRFAGSFVYNGIVLEASFLVTLLRAIDRLTPNAKITLAHGISKQVMALSWGEDTQVKLPGWADESLPTSQRFATKVLSDVQDPTMRGALDLVGGESGLDAVQLPYFRKTEIDGEPVYVDINEFRDDEVNLHLYILLTVPESDFLGEMDRMTNITIGAVCGLFVVLVAVGFLFAWCLVRPLEDLGDRMQLTASLQDDSEKSSLSTFSEIRRLQASYNTMREHLNAMKSYLPQSVIQSLLAGNSTDDADEGDDCADSQIQPSEVDLSASERSVTSMSGRPSVETSQGHVRRKGSGVSALSSGGKSSNRGKDTGIRRNAPTSSAVNVKLVTVLALNVRKTHAAWGGTSGGGAFVGLQQSFLSVMLRHVAECRGTVDTFQGDRVMVTFNAVRGVAAHGRMAATAGWQIIHDMTRHGVGITAGLSSGRALVGNMGVNEMMKFNVIGPVVNEAIGLERCARVMTGAVVTDCSETTPSERAVSGLFPNSTPLFMHAGVQVLSEIQSAFQLQPVEIAWRRAPKSISTAAERERVVLMSVNKRVAEKGDGGDEWMYELADQQVCNPCAPLTEAYLQLTSGNAEGAKSLLSSLTTTTKDDIDDPDHLLVTETTAHLRHILDTEEGSYAGWWL